MTNYEPNELGYWGEYGGRYVPETLVAPLDELIEAYFTYRDDPEFRTEFDGLLKDFVGRPSPLYYAERLSEKLGGARIYLKREDLNHTGAHKINNCVGQILLARRMGKARIIAETGADSAEVNFPPVRKNDRAASKPRVMDSNITPEPTTGYKQGGQTSGRTIYATAPRRTNDGKAPAFQ